MRSRNSFLLNSSQKNHLIYKRSNSAIIKIKINIKKKRESYLPSKITNNPILLFKITLLKIKLKQERKKNQKKNSNDCFDNAQFLFPLDPSLQPVIRRRSCTLDYVAGKSFIKITRPTHAAYYYYEVHSAVRVLRLQPRLKPRTHVRVRTGEEDCT